MIQDARNLDNVHMRKSNSTVQFQLELPRRQTQNWGFNGFMYAVHWFSKNMRNPHTKVNKGSNKNRTWLNSIPIHFLQRMCATTAEWMDMSPLRYTCCLKRGGNTWWTNSSSQLQPIHKHLSQLWASCQTRTLSPRGTTKQTMKSSTKTLSQLRFIIPNMGSKNRWHGSMARLWGAWAPFAPSSPQSAVYFPPGVPEQTSRRGDHGDHGDHFHSARHGCGDFDVHHSAPRKWTPERKSQHELNPSGWLPKSKVKIRQAEAPRHRQGAPASFYGPQRCCILTFHQPYRTYPYMLYCHVWSILFTNLRSEASKPEAMTLATAGSPSHRWSWTSPMGSDIIPAKPPSLPWSWDVLKI